MSTTDTDVAAPWRTASVTHETCVEVSPGPVIVRIRDTKDRARGHFAVGGNTWEAFIAALSGV